MPMHTTPNRLFPLIVTDRLEEVRAFYVKTLGYSLSVDTPDYLQVRFGDEAAPELCFIQKKSDGPYSTVFPGSGVTVSVPTTSADEAHAAWAKKKVSMLSQPVDLPYGWRSFTLKDPSGVVLDFFHVLPESRRPDAQG